MAVLPAAPCTISMATRRAFGVATVRRNGVCAGTIESSQGSASETPQPRRNVRRERYFLVMNIFASSDLVIHGEERSSARRELLERPESRWPGVRQPAKRPT